MCPGTVILIEGTFALFALMWVFSNSACPGQSGETKWSQTEAHVLYLFIFFPKKTPFNNSLTFSFFVCFFFLLVTLRSLARIEAAGIARARKRQTKQSGLFSVEPVGLSESRCSSGFWLLSQPVSVHCQSKALPFDNA